MRPPRPRLTIGRLMVLVATPGLVLGIVILVKKSNSYRRRAELAENRAMSLRCQIWMFPIRGFRTGLSAKSFAEIYEADREARRYRYAQRRPWLGVPDDAPAD